MTTSRQTQPITFDKRLLAEVVRLYEDAQGPARDEPQASAKARADGGDLERRIILRSQTLSITPALQTALHQVRSASALIVAAGLILSLLAGATAAQVAFASRLDGSINFFWLLAGLLGVPTLALLLWLSMIVVKPANIATGFLGAAALGLGRRVNQWLHRGAAHAAAVQAGASLLARGAIGRWTLSAITHALWLAFLVGSLTLVLLILSTKQYRFTWETTILSQPTYVSLTRALAAVPDALGFPTPDPRQIAASRWSGKGQPPNAGSDAWAGLLVGCLLVYGVLPRALLLLLSLVARNRAKTRLRLDTTLSGYARLQPDLMPVAQTLGVVDAAPIPDRGTGTASSTGEPITAIRRDGVSAILGLEITSPASGWPPGLDGIAWLDLGFVDNRDDRLRVLDRLVDTQTPPRLLVVVCALVATPDRGTRSFIQNLQTTARIPLFMILTEGQHLRERSNPGQVAQRIEDWRQLASDSQVPAERVLEMDLDHLTAASRGKLATLLGATASTDTTEQCIEQAFELIITHLRRWTGQPDVAEQAELQRAIANLYQSGHQRWRQLLKTGSITGVNRVAQVKTSADQMLALLPKRLQTNPKWLAAGALAGALGCVVAATLGATAAIAALPAWAGLGAAVSAALQTVVRPTAPAVGRPTVDLTEAVNAAALFALVLELQGHDEAAISRIIDQTAGVEESPDIDGSDTARAWLDSLRQRLDQALAREENP